MATIPYINEPQQKLKALQAPGFKNTATVESLSRGEVELAKTFGVAADKIQKYVVAKQNQLDMTKVQNASASWKDYELARRRYMLSQQGTNAEGALLKETDAWKDYRNRSGPQEDWSGPDVHIQRYGPEGLLPYDQRELVRTPPGMRWVETKQRSPGEGRDRTLHPEKYPDVPGKPWENESEWNIPGHFEAIPGMTPADIKAQGNLQTLKGNFDTMYEGLDQRQRIAVDEIIANRRPAYLHAIGVHEDNERVKALAASNEINIKHSAIEAIGAVTDVEREKKILEGENTIIADMKARGIYKKEDADIQLQAFRSGIHNGVITNLLNQPDNQTRHLEEAKKYFKEHEGEVTVATRKLINNELYKHNIVVKSNELGLQIAQLPAEEQLPAIDAIKDPDIKTATITRVYQLQNMAKRAKTKLDSDNTNLVYNWLQKKGGMIDGMPIDLNAIKSTVTADVGIQTIFQKLPAANQEKLKLILKGLIEGDKPVPEQQNLESMDEVTRMVTKDKEKFLAANLALDYYGKMKPEKITGFINLQRTMREADAKGENSDVSWTQQLDARMNQLGWVGADYAQHRGRTQDRLMTKIIEYRENSNPDPSKQKNPTDLEVQQFIKEIVTPTYALQTVKDFPIAVTRIDEFKNEAQISAYIQTQGWVNTEDEDKVTIGFFRTGVQEASRLYEQRTGTQPDEFAMAKIIKTTGEDRVFVDIDWKKDPEVLHSQAKSDKSKYPPDKLYVTLDNGDKVYLQRHLGTMDPKEAKEIGKYLNDNGFIVTHKNVAMVWRNNHKNVQLGKALPKTGPIPNPDGKQTTSVINLESAVAEAEGDYEAMVQARNNIKETYGSEALAVYDQLIAEHRPNYE